MSLLLFLLILTVKSETIFDIDLINEISNLSPTSDFVFSEILDIVTNFPEELRSVDIHLVALFLEAIAENEDFRDDSSFVKFMGVINAMSIVNRYKLQSAQLLLNSTDRMLYSLDKTLNKKGLMVSEARTPNGIIHSSVFNMNILSMGGMLNVGNETILPIRGNESELKEKNFTVAFMISTIYPQVDFVITLFQNDYLFNEENIGDENEVLGSYIIQFLNVGDPFFNAHIEIDVYFQEFESSGSKKCSYWLFGRNDSGDSILGRWVNVADPVNFKDGFYKCHFDSLGHYGLTEASSSKYRSYIMKSVILISVLFSFATKVFY